MISLDWPGMMRAGFGRLGLAPDVFWRLTPVELRMMLGAEGGSVFLTRARLEELSAAFPDVGKGKTDGEYRRDTRPVGDA